ncbi:hypothetical protein FO519_010478, partial [Halicephalobus sp. NKZ332]
MTDDYLFIYMQHRQDGFGTPIPFWIDTVEPLDGRDDEVRKACEKILILDLQPNNVTSDYNTKVIDAMYEWPFFCQGADCPPDDANTTKQAVFLSDAFYMYGRALNKTVSVNPNDTDNGTALVANSRGTFAGFSGEVTININGSREPIFYVFGLSTSGQQVIHMIIKTQSNASSVGSVRLGYEVQLFYSDERTGIW